MSAIYQAGHPGIHGLDVITGDGGDNLLPGTTGDDWIQGLGGYDTLSGLEGNDTLDGGGDNDLLIGGAGGDRLIGGEGVDTASYETSLTGLIANLGDAGQNTGDAAGDTYDGIEILVGSAFDDVLAGDAQTNSIIAGAGADTIHAGDGDFVNAGEGADHIMVDNASPWFVVGGAGDDTVSISGVSNVNGEGVEHYEVAAGAVVQIYGGDFGEIDLLGAANVTGSYDNNSIVGSAGDDTIDAGESGDTVQGGDGDDLLFSGGGHDSYDGGAGIDTLSFANAPFNATADLAVHIVQNDGFGAGLNEPLFGFENLVGGVMGDNLRGDGGDNLIQGAGGDDTLMGRDGNDTLDGGANGAMGDIMTGGDGDDTYYVDSAKDRVTESAGATSGVDLVISTITYVLGANVENLTLADGAGAIDGTGNGLENHITGNESANSLSGGLGEDTLDGGGGADTLAGGDDNDTYLVGDSDVVIIEASGGGADTVIASASYTLGAELENLTLAAGAGDIDGSGNGLDNLITGNEGANRLTGGGGLDTLVGGEGDDTYVVDGPTAVVEAPGGGTDTVVSSISYGLGDGVENLILAAGAGAITGIGNELDNLIVGNESANLLDGGVGGRDTLAGGGGDDTYLVRGPGVSVVEAAGGGTDLVRAFTSYALGDWVENLVLMTGAGAINGLGNSLDNQISGNEADNRLDGDGGADTLSGGQGDDTYIVNDARVTVVEQPFDGGVDTVVASVSYGLAANVEDLVLEAGAGDLAATGNGLDNVLTGNEGDNVLNGARGADTLAGGAGDDLYLVDNAGDQVDEQAGGGHDTVHAWVDQALAANVEDLVLEGTAGLVGRGNLLDNFITGSTGDDDLSGGGGADTLAGGLGDDLYRVSDAGTVILEAPGDGYDTVRAVVSYTLADGVERLLLRGAVAEEGIGNGLDNRVGGTRGDNMLDGGDGDDALRGKAGDDRLVGGAGQDMMKGGAGADTFAFAAAGDSDPSRPDRILDFEDGQDRIDLSALGDLHLGAQAHFSGAAGEVVVRIGEHLTHVQVDLDGDAVADLDITLKGAHALTNGDFVF